MLGSPRPGLSTGSTEIFNTDQGSQFTSASFTAALSAARIQISMDGRRRWTDNDFIERVQRSLKHEDIYLKGYADGCEAKGRDRRLDRLLQRATPSPGARLSHADGRLARGATTADDSPCGMIQAERSGRLPTKRSVQAVPLCGSILLPATWNRRYNLNQRPA